MLLATADTCRWGENLCAAYVHVSAPSLFAEQVLCNFYGANMAGNCRKHWNIGTMQNKITLCLKLPRKCNFRKGTHLQAVAPCCQQAF